MVFIEAPAFCRWREDNLDDERFRALQNVLIIDPRAGKLIAATGGLRKIRVGLPGKGKRGGARAIYYWWESEDRCYLLFAYAKNVMGDLSEDQCRRLSAAMKEALKDG